VELVHHDSIVYFGRSVLLMLFCRRRLGYDTAFGAKVSEGLESVLSTIVEMEAMTASLWSFVSC
jgi:hypothetical protein